MTTVSKKPNITEEYEKLQSTDELFREYDAYLRKIREQIKERQTAMVNEVVESGPELLGEIEEKKKEDVKYEERNKNFFVKFINMLMGW
ncbi:MAG: hypothetical protein ACOCVF_01545 [bacterium]